MTKDDLVKRAKAILAEAYEEAAEMIALYLEGHPAEQLQTLCKEIDPENWNALRKRVQRAQAARNASASADLSRPRAVSDSRVRHARSALREADAETVREIVDALPEEQRAEIVKAVIEDPSVRLRAAAEIARHEDAARGQVDSERRAGQTPAQTDHDLVTRLSYEFIKAEAAAREAVEQLAKNRGRLSPGAEDALLAEVEDRRDHIIALFDHALGHGVDSAIEQILGSTR